MEKMQVMLTSTFVFEVEHCSEYVTIKGAFEKDLVKVITAGVMVASDNGNTLNDEREKDRIIQAILYGLKEKG